MATDSKKRSRETPGSADSQQQQQKRQRLQQQQQQNKYAGCCCSAADAWQAVDAAVNNLAGFRDASLDKWHRRTVLSSGTAALRGSSGLRAASRMARTGDLSGIEDAAPGDRIDAVGYLIGIGAWSDRSAYALRPLVRTPPQLVAAAVNTPEYLTS